MCHNCAYVKQTPCSTVSAQTHHFKIVTKLKIFFELCKYFKDFFNETTQFAQKT